MAGSTHSIIGPCVRPMAVMTTRIAAPENSDLVAAQNSSPATTSASPSGVLRMASQVFCTCMREKAEYSASKLAAYMLEEATKPAARTKSQHVLSGFAQPQLGLGPNDFNVSRILFNQYKTSPELDCCLANGSNPRKRIEHDIVFVRAMANDAAE